MAITLPIEVICTTCGALLGEPCRELTGAPVVIRKSKTKRVQAMLADTPARSPHESRVRAAAAA